MAMMLDQFRLPDLLDFCPDRGQINLGSARVMLMNDAAMGALRDILVAQVGAMMSRMILAQFGYQNAVKDYQALGALFPDLSDAERLAMGPLMHAWSGIVSVKPELMHVDRDAGAFHFKGRWYNSYEAQDHLRRYGVSKEPVCFSLTGYGSGWCSSYFGSRLLEIETKCMACGHGYCEWEIKPWDEWGPEAEPWKQSLSSTSRSVHRELEHAARDLKQINERMEMELESRAKAQREQLRMICHDVEGPLRLAMHALTEEQHRHRQPGVTKALGQLSRIDQMVSRARGVSRLMDGKVVVHQETIHLVTEIEALIQDLSGQLQQKDLVVHVDLEPSMSCLGDRTILRDQVLANVFSNAIKFSPPGGVICFVGVRDALGRVGVKINDQGIGIPKALQSDIFNPRSRSSRPGTIGETGTGYGLPLAKSGVEAMGGVIELTSTTVTEDPMHHGTSVTVWFLGTPDCPHFPTLNFDVSRADGLG